jgi:hypothetical protein
MATFTYQLAYWGWVKLEKDEIKAQRTGALLYLGDGDGVAAYMLVNSRN